MNEDWQSMDTAPKDGTVIEIRNDWVPSRPRYVFVFWSNHRYSVSIEGVEIKLSRCPDGDGCWQNYPPNGIFYTPGHPMVWRPIRQSKPIPPKSRVFPKQKSFEAYVELVTGFVFCFTVCAVFLFFAVVFIGGFFK